MLIPSVKDIESIHVSDVRWILIIEKEVHLNAFHLYLSDIPQATFRTLATNQYWKGSIAGKGILITVRSPSFFLSQV
jgi:meiotic recombination protein SPO11